MDAAVKTFGNSRSLPVILLALVLPAAAWSQPALVPSPASITLNNSTNTSADVTVTSSTGDAIAFTFSTTYTPANSPQWLQVQPTGNTTPAALQLGLRTAGLRTGTYTATLTLTPTSPANAIGTTVNVTLNFGTGGGNVGTTISSTLSTVPISASSGNSGFANPAPTISTASNAPVGLTLSTSTANGVNWLSAQLSVTSISVATSAVLSIQATSAGLAAGSYQGTVTVTPDAGSPITIGVNFAVGTGGGTLSATPTPISWNFIPNSGAYPSQAIALASSSGATTFTANVTSDNNWLVLNGLTTLSGKFGDILSAFVGNGGNNLQTGNYTGNIVFTDNLNNQATITVNLTVNGGATGLTVSPSSVSIPVALGGTAQQASLSVSSTLGGAFSVTASSSTNPPWLTASTSSSNLGANGTGSVLVAATPGNLANGTYTGSLNVSVGGQTTSVQVSMVVGTGGGGTVSGIAAPSDIAFTLQTGGTGFVNGPPIEINGSGNWSAAVSYGSGATGWITLVSPSGSALPAQANFSIDRSNLGQPGTYTATIAITTAAGTQNVNVSVIVVSGAVLRPTPAGLAFTDQTSGSQTVFFNTSDGSQFDLRGAVTSNAPWISIAPVGPGQQTISISVDRSGLPAGLYNGSVAIGVSGFPSVTLPVTLLIGGGGSATGLSFSPSSLAFSSTVGNNPAQKTFTVSAAVQTNYTATASTSTGGNWLSVTPGTGNTLTNPTITVSVNSAGLAAGTYSGFITFNTGQSYPVSLTVTATGNGSNLGNVTTSPTAAVGLAYTAQTGAAVVPTQKIQVTSAGATPVDFIVQTTTDGGGNWLSTDVASAAIAGTPRDVTVTVNATGLAAGAYTGKVKIIPFGGATVDVPVKLTVTPPPSISASPATLTFSFRAGAANPAAQPISVTGNGGTLGFTATASSTGNWLQVSPASGTTPATGAATLNVSVNGTGLAPGTYTGSIVVAGSGGAPGSTTVSVTLTVTVPVPTISRVTNGASFALAGISPGEVITLFGTDLGPSTPVFLTDAPGGQVATTLGGVQVAIGGFNAPMIYASSTQVSAVVPYELAQFTSANVIVKYQSQTSNGVLSNISTSTPGIFTQNSSGTGPGAILNQNGSVNSAANPAARGETIVIYMTGEGQTSPAGVTGKVTVLNPAPPPLTPAPLLPPSVLIGGQPVTEVSFIGEAPGFVSGVLQVNVIVPTNIPAGDQTVVVSLGGNASQAGVTVSLK